MPSEVSLSSGGVVLSGALKGGYSVSRYFLCTDKAGSASGSL